MSDQKLMSNAKVQKLFKAEEVCGSGRFAVIFCSYTHPSAGQQACKVKRFERLTEAERSASDHFLSWPGWCKHGYCHGCVKTKASVSRHPVVDLQNSSIRMVYYVKETGVDPS